jgi:hypothetical protein
MTGAQERIILWVARHTYGWNRPRMSYTWYRIAKELNMDRGAVYRAGKALLRAGVLVLHERCLAIQADPDTWDRLLFSSNCSSDREPAMPGSNVANPRSQALSAGNGVDVWRPLGRCQKASDFRQPKDSFIERSKTNKESPAGAAKPIPNKYAGIRQN